MKRAHVLITGASSGIGQALALACAAPGVRLHLCGRDAARLAAMADAARAAGATVAAAVLDVADAPATEAWVRAAAPLDLVVANAGIGGGTGPEATESAAQVRAIFATNLAGALATMLPALEVMAAQPADAQGVRGRIVAIASLAAFFAAPGAPSYCASKSALDAWTVATAASAARQGVRLLSVCPGYIRTAMTAGNRFPMPGLMDADRAARIILAAAATRRRRVAFPWPIFAAARLMGLLPPRIIAAMLAGTEPKDPARL
jgi:short-subunit dehydrogenase